MGLYLHFVLYQKQPSLCSLLTWHTLSHTWLSQFKLCMNRWKEQSTMHVTYWLQLYRYFFSALIVTYHTYLFSFLNTHIFHAHCIRVEQQPSQLDVGALAEVPGCAVPVKATRCWFKEKHYYEWLYLFCTLSIYDFGSKCLQWIESILSWTSFISYNSNDLISAP